MGEGVLKPYQAIPIQECGEVLVSISSHPFAFVEPHPYVVLDAPYDNKSPYYLRQSVYERLTRAHLDLQQQQPRWRIQIFDAYRPIAVQQFMVDHAYRELLKSRQLDASTLSPDRQHELLTEVYQFWAHPSDDPTTPPPHSTGAALDVSIVDGDGVDVDMGAPIDELSPRSYPDYYAPDSIHRVSTDETPVADCNRFHQNRQLLAQVMGRAGFQQHPNEWWHFSYGDQLWAWLTRTRSDDPEAIARYGRI